LPADGAAAVGTEGDQVRDVQEHLREAAQELAHLLASRPDPTSKQAAQMIQELDADRARWVKNFMVLRQRILDHEKTKGCVV
jgi:hypothetical protein